MHFIGFILATFIGLSLGLLGGGGSILTVPVLVYVLGWPAKTAIAGSLAVVGITSLFGVLVHYKQKNIHFKIALIFGGIAMIGTYLGARIAEFLSGATQLVIFALVMAIAAFFMLRPKTNLNDADRETVIDLTHLPYLLIGIQGLGVGILTGLVGVGGGFMIVPALTLLARLPMKLAVGTSLLVIVMNTASGFFGYLGHTEIPWKELGLFSLFAILGIYVSSFLIKKISAQQLRKVFGIFLILVSLLILYKNREQLFLVF